MLNKRVTTVRKGAIVYRMFAQRRDDRNKSGLPFAWCLSLVERISILDDVRLDTGLGLQLMLLRVVGFHSRELRMY